MRSDQYWARRMDDLNEAMLNKGEAYIRRQNEEYEKALAKIKRQTESWYARLARNNDVSLAEARKLLTANELKEFHWDVQEYIKRGRENAVDQRWVKELENASAKVHITRLEELQTHLRNEVEQLAAKRQKGTADTMGGIYKDSYYKSLYEMQKGAGVGSSFAALDDRQIDKVLAKPWAPDGSNFSARIWGDRTKLVNELQTILTQDLIRGEPAERVISDFADRMGVSKRDAARLIRTEAAYFSGQSRLDAYRETGVEQYKYVATLDSRTSEICQDMDGKVIPISEARAGVNYPPLHVYCRSTTIPFYEDAEAGERAARDAEGQTYMVPGDMTYKDWAAKHAPPDATKPPGSEPPTPRELPKVQPADPYVPAKSIPEAEEAAKRDYGFDEVDYNGLSIDDVNAINEAIDKSLREFPGIKGFAKRLVVVDDKQYAAMARLWYEHGAPRSELYVSKGFYNSSADAKIDAAVKSNHWPQATTRSSVFAHEFGHIAEYAHALKLLGTWTGSRVAADDVQIAFARITRGTLSRDIVAEALSNLGLPYTAETIRKELSGYAATNSSEALAEAFAEAVGTENPRRLALEILNILKRKMTEVGL